MARRAVFASLFGNCSRYDNDALAIQPQYTGVVVLGFDAILLTDLLITQIKIELHTAVENRPVPLVGMNDRLEFAQQQQTTQVVGILPVVFVNDLSARSARDYTR